MCGILLLLWVWLGFCFVMELETARLLSDIPPRGPLKKALLFSWRDGAQDIFRSPFWSALQKAFLRHGYLLQTQQVYSSEQSDLVFCVSKCPKNLPPGKPVYLYLLETPFSWPSFTQEQAVKTFKRIWTYDTDLIKKNNIAGEGIYAWLPIPHPLRKQDKIISGTDSAAHANNTLISMVLSNHYNNKSNYQARRQTAKYLIENHPEDFALYGRGWERLKNELSPQGVKNFQTVYKGYIASKSDAMRHTKFFLAYENAIHSGYVSEKIIDGIETGAVPVYLGAPDVSGYIPQGCFINRADFESEEALYVYLKQMPDEVYHQYQTCLSDFIQNAPNQHVAFNVDAWVNIIIRDIFSRESLNP